MAYDMNWIKQVRAAKGNTANTNTGAGQRTRTTSRSTSTKSSSSGVTARGGGDVRRRVTTSGGPRKATAAEKARYASRATYTPRTITGTPGIPSWTKTPIATRGSVKIYRQYNTPSLYYQRGSRVYRYDGRNNRWYKLDNGLMSGGVIVSKSSLPEWLRKVI